MKLLRITIILLTIIATTTAHAHGGRTDANGCHKEKKTGTRHCH